MPAKVKESRVDLCPQAIEELAKIKGMPLCVYNILMCEGESLAGDLNELAKVFPEIRQGNADKIFQLVSHATNPNEIDELVTVTLCCLCGS